MRLRQVHADINIQFYDIDEERFEMNKKKNSKIIYYAQLTYYTAAWTSGLAAQYNNRRSETLGKRIKYNIIRT